MESGKTTASTSHYQLLLRAYEKAKAKLERAKTEKKSAKHYYKNATKETEKTALEILNLQFKKAKYKEKIQKITEKIARLRLKAWEKTHSEEVKTYQLAEGIETEKIEKKDKPKKKNDKSDKKSESLQNEVVTAAIKNTSDTVKEPKVEKKETSKTTATKTASAKGNSKIDNFIPIEGIGPKINEILHAHNIKTFAQLASKTTDELKVILFNAGNRLADPSTWAQQADLLAKNKLDELKSLQDKLKGGRKV